MSSPEPVSNTRTLLDSPDHRITSHLPQQQTDTLVITFNPMRMGLADSGFGSALMQRLGYAHVFVAEGRDSFYQALRPEDLARAIGPLLADHPRLFLYGSSLGGHAALYYANALAGTAIALSPRLPPHPYMKPHLGPQHRVFARTKVLHPDLPAVADPRLSPVVILDPNNAPDEDYVSRFVVPAYPLARLRHTPGAGHRVARLLAYQRQLRPLITALLASGQVPPIRFDPQDRPSRHLAQALRALDRGDTARAGPLLQRVLSDKRAAPVLEAIARYHALGGPPLDIGQDAAAGQDADAA